MKQTELIKRVMEASGWMMGTLKESILQLNPSPWQTVQKGKEHKVDLVTAAFLECYSAYLVMLVLTLPMLSIAVLGVCSAQSTHLSWL
jgi:hypothetical protein